MKNDAFYVIITAMVKSVRQVPSPDQKVLTFDSDLKSKVRGASVPQFVEVAEPWLKYVPINQSSKKGK